MSGGAAMTVRCGQPLILCLDVEPDDREVVGQHQADWLGTGPFLDLVDEFRAKAACSGLPVHMNWFLRQDPQIRDAYGRADFIYHRFRSYWDRAAAHGDGIGSHVHAWRRIGGRWLADHGDRAWVGRCVDESLDVYEQVIGRPPLMFRFGDHFMSNDVIRRLVRRGVRYDLSLEPGVSSMDVLKPGEYASGKLPDYTAIPRRSYIPSRVDFRRPSRWFPRPIRMIPISTGVDNGIDVPNWGRGIHSPLNLALNTDWMTRISDRILADTSKDYLVWVARTGDYGHPEFKANMRANLSYLASLGLPMLRPDEIWG